MARGGSNRILETFGEYTFFVTKIVIIRNKATLYLKTIKKIVKNFSAFFWIQSFNLNKIIVDIFTHMITVNFLQKKC